MSTDNVLFHPAFGKPPVVNPRWSSQNDGTIRLNVARTRRGICDHDENLVNRLEAEQKEAARFREPLGRLYSSLRGLTDQQIEHAVTMLERFAVGCSASR